MTLISIAKVREHRIEYIDGLRALAVIGVIISHVVSHRWQTPSPARSIALEGAHGVDLFFVLSGFCLAFPTLAKLRRFRETRFDVVEFAAKRLVRIVPPFYIATALLVLGLIVIPAIVHRGHHRPWTPYDISASLLFIDGHVTLLNASFWTLMVEFRWYFVFPLVLALWVASPRAFFTLGGALIVLYHFTRARGLDLGTLPGFMLGIVAADVQIGGRATLGWARRLRRWALPLAIAWIAVGVASEPFAMIPGDAYGADVRWAYQPTILGWQLGVFCFVVAAGALRPLTRLLSARALVATGVASYGIYLVHQPVVEIVENVVHGPAGPVAALALAPLAGFAFWALAERPFTTGPLRAPLVHWFADHLRPVAQAAGVPRAVTMREPSLPAVAAQAAPAVPEPAIEGA